MRSNAPGKQTRILELKWIEATPNQYYGVDTPTGKIEYEVVVCRTPSTVIWLLYDNRGSTQLTLGKYITADHAMAAAPHRVEREGPR